MKKIAIAAAVLFGAIFLFLIVEHFRGKWGLLRWRARMAAKGEPLTIGAVTAPVPPPNQNGMPALNIAGSQTHLFPRKILPPVTLDAEPGKRIVVMRLASWRSEGRIGTNVTWEILDEILKPLEPALKSAMKALISPEFNANLNYYDAWGTRLIHISRLRYLEWTLTAAALHRLHRGDFDDGVDFTAAAIRAPVALKDEAFSISQNVRFIMAREAFETTWQAAHVDGLSDAHLKQLQDTWAEHDFLKPLRRALAMEHVMASHEYRRMRNTEVSVYDWLGCSLAPPRPLIINSPFDMLVDAIEKTPAFVQNQIFNPLWKFTWSHQDELRYVQTVEEGLKTWDVALSQQSAAPLQLLGDADYRGLMETSGTLEPMTFRYMLSPRAGRFFPVMKNAFVAQTLRELAIGGIALKRYELRHGKPALSLQALVPDFLPALPRDFMDGKALKYELTNGVMTVFSSGLDSRNDAGNLKSLVWPAPASSDDSEPFHPTR